MRIAWELSLGSNQINKLLELGSVAKNFLGQERSYPGRF